ncbi:LysR family transcriptional regulator [uncultured Megasphaera sp.]|uniref:LysR family transcriptional regulator n=1 Tax=uncultured Megasphaera sp. TaxID=165188 RepID=UPI0025F9AEDA|nr:LysR family transcriptional regulator [uncultured Megasphaera sp.]
MQRYIALLKIIEVGSFTKAADLLGYTQPALSQMIASLEKELSIKILYRSRYGIRLTPEGERLYPSIQNAVIQYQTMRHTADEIRGLDSGIVRIGTVSSVSCHWLPGIIRRFWQKYPNIQIVLHQGDYTSISEWVRTGAVDFGFVNPNAVKGMETTFIKSGEFRAVLPKYHPLSEKQSLSLKDLANEPFLLLEEGAYSEPLEAFHAIGITPNIKLRVHDDYSILSMVEQGLGISILTELVLRKTSYEVVALPIDPVIIRTMSIITKDKNTLPQASKKFIHYLLEEKNSLY